MTIIKTVNGLKERQDKVEEEIGKIRKDMTRLETENQSMKLATSKLGKNLEEIMDGKFSDAMIAKIGKEMEKITKNVTSDLSNVKEYLQKIPWTPNRKLSAQL